MNQTVTVVNIASGDPDLLNAKTLQALREGGRLVLRTSVTPLVSFLNQEKISFSSLDDLYDAAEDFHQLSVSMAERIWSLAASSPVVYAVPDLMTDASVRMVCDLRPEKGRLVIIPGLGLSGLYHASARPLLPGPDLFSLPASALLTSDYNPNVSLLVTELDNLILAGEVKLFLSSYLDDESEVYFLRAPEEAPVPVRLFELDRQLRVDHLSAVLIPGTGYPDRGRFVLEDLLRIMDRLRAPDGCPWDRVQTHQSLKPYMIEEAWECVAAIDEQSDAHLSEELGDLLFQIVFHASIGKDFDEFDMTDVVSSICRKMIHRHPHVFAEAASGPVSAPSPAEWEKLKRSETGSRSVLDSLDDVSPALPSLKYAAKVLKKCSSLPSFDCKPSEVISALLSCLGHPPEDQESFMEKVLFLSAKLCYSLNLDGELLLRRAVTKYKNQLQSSGQRTVGNEKPFEGEAHAD